MSGIDSKICKASGIGEVMGKKWSLSILKTLGTNSPLHSNELKKYLLAKTSECQSSLAVLFDMKIGKDSSYNL